MHAVMDLSTLDAPQLALLTTLLGASIGLTGALVSAGINAWNARWLAKDAARREYRQDALKHILTVADTSVQTFVYFHMAVSKKQVEKAQTFLNEIFDSASPFKTIAFTTVVTGDEILNTAAKRFAHLYQIAVTNANTALRAIKNGDSVPDNIGIQDTEDLFNEASYLRQAAEDFILGTKSHRKRLRKTFTADKQTTELQKQPT